MSFGGRYTTLPGFVAAASMAAQQYYVVRLASTAGQVAVGATAATDPLIGIVQNDPAAGEPAEVAVAGVCRAAAEASVGIGAKLTVSSTGRVLATTTDKDEIIGIACQASGAAGDIITVLLSRFTLSQ